LRVARWALRAGVLDMPHMTVCAVSFDACRHNGLTIRVAGALST
jgi:hypothetical protein